MRDGNDDNLSFANLILRDEDDGAGPVLGAFLTTLAIFTVPKILIANDEAGFRRWQAHGVQSLMRSSR